MEYAEFEAMDRRLVLLRALESAAQYKANALLLQRYCVAIGHAVTTDRMQHDLAWLHEQGLVTLETAHGIKIATLTARGLDVAQGLATVPGVQRPTPGF